MRSGTGGGVAQGGAASAGGGTSAGSVGGIGGAATGATAARDGGSSGGAKEGGSSGGASAEGGGAAAASGGGESASGGGATSSGGGSTESGAGGTEETAGGGATTTASSGSAASKGSTDAADAANASSAATTATTGASSAGSAGSEAGHVGASASTSGIATSSAASTAVSTSAASTTASTASKTATTATAPTESLASRFTSTSPVCFRPGTSIATPAGSVPVETLVAGDLVTLADGRSLAVRWLGRQTLSSRFADPLRAHPIRIRAGALGDGVPKRDLFVSPDHALFVDGILAHASALVNGLSITRETEVPEVLVYHHVELCEHALILAEGAPAESFVDNPERLAFDNWGERAALPPGSTPGPELDLPRAKSARQVPSRIRSRLAARAEAQVVGLPLVA